MVVWKGYGLEDATWEPVENLEGAEAQLQEWESLKAFMARPKTGTVPRRSQQEILASVTGTVPVVGEDGDEEEYEVQSLTNERLNQVWADWKIAYL